jgi:isoleucyl-tRNA synthetase
VRRPLGKATVASPDPEVRAAIEQFADAITGELNVKAVEVIADDSALCKVTAKPNFRTLGKRLGPKLKAVQAALLALSGEELSALEERGTIELAGELLTRDDVLLTREAVSAGAVESQGGLTVLLDTKITPELHAEGIARELVNRIQNLRKQANLDVSQRIRLVLACDGVLGEVADSETLSELIARETLTSELEHVRESAREDVIARMDHVKEDVIERERILIALSAV